MSTAALRFVALVPAAGRSRRMGIEKLTLPYRGRPLIQHVIEAFTGCGQVEEVLVVVPRNNHAVRAVLESIAVTIVLLPEATGQMRETVERGLRWLEHHRSLAPTDAVLIAPGDCVAMTQDVVQAVVEGYRRNPGTLCVPRDHQRRGHPLGLPWSGRKAVYNLPADRGLNWLLRSQPLPVQEIPCSLPPLEDVDTPLDWQRLTGHGCGE